ncbi:MAG: UvrD-helicase domain-containing protein [Burkholderiaceae bacterium]|uniref:UvrD-helicase domain-containing protein n=1 Tax=Ottowia sp. TaxID=1898956 RepID=UPI002BEF72A9|nr:UvrD-helicase domain-containing protein [Ottowia sp.]MCP5259384.1 UvrD-helicase domain-containing protein [Burkholderiaceae bacterium]HRW73167.1 UvrD-helicase domain-containing protein [Ottowia sp.]
MNQPAYEHNGQPVDAAAFYAIACDPRRSVAVEACAGAGKTWMLISRIVRALIEPGPDGHQAAPHEILAITFTRKAAGEMRRRLDEQLQSLALASDARLDQDLLAFGVPPDRVPALREPLRGAWEAMLASGRPVQVRTFHSWFGALLKQAPLELLRQLGLPPSYELLMDDGSALAEAWRPFLAAVAQSAELQADYTALVAAHGRFSTEKALQSALQKRAEFTLADEAGVVEASVPRHGELFAELAAFDDPADALFDHAPTADLLAEAAAVLAQASAPTFAAKGVELREALAARAPDQVTAALLTQAGEPRKFGKLGSDATLRAAQDALLRILAAGQQHQAWQHQQRLARLARCLLGVFAEVKRARGWVDMGDLERAAQLLLTDEVLAGWVQQRLDARVRHLLIDEFQDTSPVQWQALRDWLSGYAGAGGGGAISVFIVGDPKQSIYRFRRAEPQVFRAAQAFVQQALEGERLACDHTRRNAPGVIEVVNATLLAAQADGAYEGFRAHTTASPDPRGALLALPPIQRAEREGEEADPLAWRDTLTMPRVEAEETLRAQEVAQAARWVQAQIEAGVSPGEILVMARRNEPLAAMQDALRALGVATEMPEKAALPDAPVVQDVIALVDALVSPAHDLSLARALRSPIVGASDAELVELALLARAQPGRPWLDLLQQQELLATVWQGRAADLMQYRHWLATLPPHDALQAIVRHADLPARYAAATPAPERARTLAQLQALLGAALDLQGGRYLTAYALVRAFRSRTAQAIRTPPLEAGAQAVRLLTVHGAKGLEADVVLLLDTQAGPGRKDTMGALIDWPGEARVPRQFVFLTHESRPPPSAQPLMEAELAERAREELNALYVALTRARRTLVLSSITPARQSAVPTWWDRLQALARPVEAPPASAAHAEGEAPPAQLLEVPNWAAARTEQAQPAMVSGVAGPASPAPPQDSEVSRIGQAMHWLIERAGLRPAGAPAPGWSDGQRAAAARRFALDAAQLAQAQQAAGRILAGEAAWAWHEGEVLDAFDEVELVHEGQRLRIDRLVRRRAGAHGPEAWWVLDHKSAAHPERDPELMAQVARYRDAVQNIHSGEMVRAGLLSGDGRLFPVA